MENSLISLLEGLGLEKSSIGPMYWIIVILGIILLLLGSNFICQRIIIPIVNIVTKKTSTTWDEILLNKKTLKSTCNLIVAIIITALLPIIVDKNTALYIIVSKAIWVYIILLFIMVICSLLSSLYIISSSAEKTRNHTLQGVFQMLKIATIFIGIIIIASIVIDKDPMKLLAGLGASAAVLMLVFKDSIMGLVAGVQLSANDMLRPGDWITMPKYDADGFVIDVTLTTVKVRNWDNTISTIPPYALVSDSFQNWRGMWDSGGRRIKRSIFIDMNSISFCSDDKREELIEKGYLGSDKDEKIVNIIREGLEKKGGYCPCKVGKHEDIKCMCKEFREQIADPNYEGFCHCFLYYKHKFSFC